jgi:hypothetical protein
LVEDELASKDDDDDVILAEEGLEGGGFGMIRPEDVLN